MSKKFLTFFLIFIAAVAEISLFPGIFFGRIAPDIVLVFLIIWAARQKFETFWLWALSAGIILDMISLGIIGVNAASFLVISFGINSVSKRFFLSQKEQVFWGIAALVFSGTIMHYLMSLTFFSWGMKVPIGFSGHDLTFKIINNLILLAIIYWPTVNSRKIFPMEQGRLIVK